MPNRLAGATSPYLLQHADNPVDWWEWEEQAFAEARRRDVPVMLSIGYAACHWCHVMAHESFEDPGIAAYLNEHFVNVKVDREERPDVDAVYMEAVQAMTGHGGWPLTAFLTPSGEPFYCGTYFPPKPGHGMPSFPELLESIARTWTERRGEVKRVGAEVVRQLAERSAPSGSAQPPTTDDLDAAVALLGRDFDALHAGFGGAPKFPPSMVLEFLLRNHARTGSPDARTMTARTCERMARGGMYDQLGGGFARYSVDREWAVPHFEKMLYDNALLLRVYLNWWKATGSPLGSRVVQETAAFLLDDLRTAEGGFASALDADTPAEARPDGSGGGGHGVEGLTYVWTPAQLREVLGESDGAWAADLLTVTATGTFEHGSSTLQLRKDPDDPERWSRVRAALREARASRPQPGRDDKVVAAWNGLAITALAEAAVLLDEPSYLTAALEAADLLVRVHLHEGRLRRTSRDGVAGRNAGVLEDYADVADAFLALLSATGDPQWLTRGGEVLDVALTRFADGSGGFYDTADDAELLVRRPQDPTDTATPSGTSALAGALLSYSALTGSARHREAAQRALRVAGSLARRAPRFAGWGLAVAEALVAGPLEVAVLGPAGDPGRAALLDTARRTVSPGAVVVAGDPTRPEVHAVPLLRDRPLVGGRAAAYVCRGFTCQTPVTEPTALADQLGLPDWLSRSAR